MPDDMDMETIRGMKELMASKFPDVVEKYIQNAEASIQKIEDGLRNDSFHDISVSVHPLKSSSAVLGLFTLSSIAERMEFLANEANDTEQSLGEVQALFVDLQGAFADVKEKLLAEANA